jgi:amidophosphoribosyltransferase
VNAQELRDDLVSQGSIFQTTSDTEVLLHLYARSKAATIEQAIVDSVTMARGAFSLVLLTKDRLIAVRDPHGFRPLTLGRLNGAYIVCSETCALDLIGAEWVRDIEPGEVFVVGPEGEKSLHPFPSGSRIASSSVYFPGPTRTCSARRQRSPDRTRPQARHRAARPADVVVPIPTPACAACGRVRCAAAHGTIPNHYVGRTFIDRSSRFGILVCVKLNPVRVLQGRRGLVDDSIVRGTTSHQIVRWSAPPAPVTRRSVVRRPSHLLLRRRYAQALRTDPATFARGNPPVSARTRWDTSAGGLLSSVANRRSLLVVLHRYPSRFPEQRPLQLALKLVE